MGEKETRSRALHTLRNSLVRPSIPLVLTGADLRVLFINDAAKQQFEWNDVSILGAHFPDIVRATPPDDIDVHHFPYNEIWYALAREEPSSCFSFLDQVSLPTTSGGQHSYWVAASKLSVTPDHCFLFVMYPLESDANQQARDKLLLLAANYTNRGFLILDGHRQTLQINEAVTNILGYEGAELIGQRPSELLTSDNTDLATLERLRTISLEHTGFEGEIVARHKDGHDIWLRFSLTHVPCCPDRPPEDRRIIAVISDVSVERRVRDFRHVALRALASQMPFQKFGQLLVQQLLDISPSTIPALLLVSPVQTLDLWASGKLPSKYLDSINGMSIDQVTDACGASAIFGTEKLSDNIEGCPKWHTVSSDTTHTSDDSVDTQELTSCWSYPIRLNSGDIVGLFVIFATETNPTQLHDRLVELTLQLSALAIEKKQSAQRIERLTLYDQLTGLPNRSRLTLHLEHWQRQSNVSYIAACTIGIDHFKSINHALGMSAGDTVLIMISKRLQTLLQPQEYLSRTEGDHFVILLPECNNTKTMERVTAFQDAIAAPIEIAGHAFYLSASVGIDYRHLPHDRQQSINEFLEHSKQAMYSAKATKRGSRKCFNTAMSKESHDKLALISALKRAFANNFSGLSMHYQPQVSIQDNEITGFEALARWHDRDLGHVPPGNFIGIAEETGLIEPLGKWAIREVCRQIREWIDIGMKLPSISVNLSPINFRNPDLPEYIEAVLSEFNLPGAALIIEITESSTVSLTNEMLSILQNIRELGIGLSIDDFGTGFSSLANLINLPVTEIKIDRSFISRCVHEPSPQALIAAVVGLGRSLQMKVIAEGVETEEQWSLLKSYRCPVAQGYLLSRPMPAVDVMQWIHDYRTDHHDG